MQEHEPEEHTPVQQSEPDTQGRFMARHAQPPDTHSHLPAKHESGGELAQQSESDAHSRPAKTHEGGRMGRLSAPRRDFASWDEDGEYVIFTRNGQESSPMQERKEAAASICASSPGRSMIGEARAVWLSEPVSMFASEIEEICTASRPVF